MIVEALERADTPAQIDEEPFRDGYAALLMPLALAGAVAGLRSRAGARRALGRSPSRRRGRRLVDDVSNGPRPWRRLVTRPKRTWNVLAHAGRTRRGSAAARSSSSPTTTPRPPAAVFDQSPQRWLAAHLPGVRSSGPTRRSAVVAGGPAPGAGGARRRDGAAWPLAAGAALSALNPPCAPTSPAARSSPARTTTSARSRSLVALAERLRARPVTACACCSLLRRRGGPSGRHLRLHRAPPAPPRPAAHLGAQPRHDGLAELILAGGRGAVRMEDYTTPASATSSRAAAPRVGRAHAAGRARPRRAPTR